MNKKQEKYSLQDFVRVELPKIKFNKTLCQSATEFFEKLRAWHLEINPNAPVDYDYTTIYNVNLDGMGTSQEDKNYRLKLVEFKEAMEAGC